MRTNIVIEEKLIEQARRLTSLPTKKAVVDEALRTLIRLKKQEKILSLRGKIHWQGDLDELRSGRHHGSHRRHNRLDRFFQRRQDTADSYPRDSCAAGRCGARRPD